MMTRRVRVLLALFLFVSVTLFSTLPARADGHSLEFTPFLEGAGDLTLSFDLPPDFTITESDEVTAWAEGPIRTYPSEEPGYMTIRTGAEYGADSRAAFAQEIASEELGGLASDVLADGDLDLGDQLGYYVELRSLVATNAPDYSTALVVVVEVPVDTGGGHTKSPLRDGTGYVWLVALDDIEYFEYHGAVDLETGESQADWGQRGFDSILESLSLSVQPIENTEEATPTAVPPGSATAGGTNRGATETTPVPDNPAQAKFVQAIPGPNEISKHADVIGSNVFLTLVIILVFAFTSSLFNSTIDENRGEIEGWLGRFTAPFRGITAFFREQFGKVTEQRGGWQGFIAPAAILALMGLIYGFLDPSFGWNWRSVVLFLSLALAAGAITYLYEGGQVLFTSVRFNLQSRVTLYGVAIVVAIGCVLLSRIVDFQPGFLLGFVATYALLSPVALDRKQEGQLVFFSGLSLLAFSFVAWLVSAPLEDWTAGKDGWWVAWVDLPHAVTVTIFAMGLEGVFFSMIPLRFMDGAKLASWSRSLWLLLFGLSGFLFCWVLLNPGSAYIKAMQQSRVVTALCLLAFYCALTLGTWAFFRWRAQNRARTEAGSLV
jgi:hypothetical protein